MKKFTKLSKAEMKTVLGGGNGYNANPCFVACIALMPPCTGGGDCNNAMVRYCLNQCHLDADA